MSEQQIKKTSAARGSTIEELEMLQKVDKVYEELGRESLYQPIIDDTPNLLRQDDLKIHFDSIKTPAFAARIYVFDRYVVVSKPSGEDKTPVLPKVWFGVQSAFRDIERSSETSGFGDIEPFDANVEELEEFEFQEREDRKQFTVVAWYDLARLKSHCREKDENLTLTFTKVEKDQIEVSADIVTEHTKVESSSIIMPSTAATKDICRLVQENISRLEAEDEEDRFGRLSIGDASVATRKDTDAKSAKSNTMGRTLESKSIFQEMPIRGQKKSINIEAAAFTVFFQGSSLGFKLAASKESLPFVNEIIENSLAAYAGVVVTDRIKAVNDEEITVGTPSEVCTKLIAKHKDNGNVKIMFVRDYAKAKELEEAKGIKNLKPIPAKPKSNTKTRRVSNSTLGSKASGNSAITSQTSGRRVRKRTKGKRSFANKLVAIKDMSYLVTSVKDMKEMKKRPPGALKSKTEKMLKEMMAQHKPHSEALQVLGCVNELYQTEFAYIANLNALRGCQIKLMHAKKYVSCKKLRKGKLFCEHKNIRLRCNRQSKIREKVVTKADLDPIFLNLTTIIKASLFLFNSVNRGLAKLADKYQELKKNPESTETVEICDIVMECCDRYSDIAPFLQMFWAYCRRFTSACTHLKHLRSTNLEFAKHCRILQNKFGKKLPNLMQRPVSRITRYHLLFTSLYKYMQKYKDCCVSKDDCSESQEKLKETLMKVEGVRNKLFTVADKVNKKVGESKTLDAMVEVYNEIGGDDGIKYLFKPHRRFESNYRVEYQNTFTFGGKEDQEEEKAVLYIFNDMIVVGALREASKKRASIGAFAQLIMRRQSNKKSNKHRTAVAEGQLSVAKNSAGKKHQTNASDTSTGTKEALYFIEVLFHTQLNFLTSIEKENQKTERGTLYALRCSYTKKTGESSFDTSNIVFWSHSDSERDEIEATLQRLKDEFDEKQLALEKAKVRHGSFKKINKMVYRQPSKVSQGSSKKSNMKTSTTRI